MTTRGSSARLARTAPALLAGILAGAILIQPAVAHVTRAVRHTWKHLRPLADARYVLQGTPVAWGSIQGIPGGFADGTDDESGGGGPATDVNCAGCVNTSDLAVGAVTSAAIADDAVGSAELGDNSVGLAALVDNAVGSAEIVDDAVGSAEIATAAVGEAEIAFNAVGSSQIRTDAVGGPEVLNESLSSTDLAGGSVGASEFGLTLGTAQSVMIPGGAAENGSYNTGQVLVDCGSGEIIGVSTFWTLTGANLELVLSESRRIGQSQWLVIGGNDSGSDASLQVTPLCLV